MQDVKITIGDVWRVRDKDGGTLGATYKVVGPIREDGQWPMSGPVPLRGMAYMPSDVILAGERIFSMIDHLNATLAVVIFRAYGDHCGWKSWDGRPMPRWDASDYPTSTPAHERPVVNDAVKSHWLAAATRAREQIMAGG